MKSPGKIPASIIESPRTCEHETVAASRELLGNGHHLVCAFDGEHAGSGRDVADEGDVTNESVPVRGSRRQVARSEFAAVGGSFRCSPRLQDLDVIGDGRGRLESDVFTDLSNRGGKFRSRWHEMMNSRIWRRMGVRTSAMGFLSETNSCS